MITFHGPIRWIWIGPCEVDDVTFSDAIVVCLVLLALKCCSSSSIHGKLYIPPTRFSHFKQMLLFHFQSDDYSIKGPAHAAPGTPNKKKRKKKFAFINASDSESGRSYRNSVKRHTEVRIHYLILSLFALKFKFFKPYKSLFCMWLPMSIDKMQEGGIGVG